MLKVFMFDHLMLLVWFLLCNVCVSSEWMFKLDNKSKTNANGHGNGTAKSAWPTVSTTTSQTDTNVTISPATMAPAEYVNYTLEISSSGPAVLDSIMIFTAKLKDSSGHYAQSNLFKYLWTNTADMAIKRTVDDYDASIKCKFSSDDVVPGQYLMTVTVYVRNTWPKTIVAFGSLQMYLTENLNGKLNFHQQLAYQRKNSTFSTGQIMKIHANISDKFSDFTNPLLRTTFHYFWYKNKTLVDSTAYPFFDFTPSEAGNITLSTVIVVELESEETTHYSASLLLTSQPCESLRQEKCGIMEQPISIKESLKSVHIDGDADCPTGGSARINVTCDGSFSSYPIAVCWIVMDANYTLPPGNASCEPTVFVNSCIHHVEVQLNSTGRHVVLFTVYNEVGFISGKHFLLGYDPGSKSSPLLVIPVVFSIIGIVIILLGVGFILRLRKKPLVEVADFDFHPSLSQEGSLLARAKNVLYKGRSSSSLPRYESPRNRPYGSFLMNETL